MTGSNDEPPPRQLWALGLWHCEASATRARLFCADVLMLERQAEEPGELARLVDDWHEAVAAHHARLLDFIALD